MEDILKEIAKDYLYKHGKTKNYGDGHVVREVEFQGNLIEMSIGGYHNTIWINKVQVR